MAKLKKYPFTVEFDEAIETALLRATNALKTRGVIVPEDINVEVEYELGRPRRGVIIMVASRERVYAR